MKEGASKLARSAGASPAQVGPSKPPGGECCVRRRRRRTRSVHSWCVGCGSEPRNDLLAGAETVFIVERNTSSACMRGNDSSRRGRGPHHVHKDRVGTWDISCLTTGHVPTWSASGRRGAVADDARTREVELRHSSCEADEQGGAIRCGAGGAKGGGRGECGPAKHAPDSVPG